MTAATKRPRSLTPQDEARAMARITAGEHVSAVAESVGASRSALYRAMERHGIEPPAHGFGQPPVPPETVAKIIQLRQEGRSVKETAAAVEVSPRTVSRVWARHRSPR